VFQIRIRIQTGQQIRILTGQIRPKNREKLRNFMFKEFSVGRRASECSLLVFKKTNMTVFDRIFFSSEKNLGLMRIHQNAWIRIQRIRILKTGNNWLVFKS
jgi:hypothetical protein